MNKEKEIKEKRSVPPKCAVIVPVFRLHEVPHIIGDTSENDPREGIPSFTVCFVLPS